MNSTMIISNDTFPNSTILDVSGNTEIRKDLNVGGSILSDSLTVSGNATIRGNLTLDGSATYVNTTTLMYPTTFLF